MPTPDTNLSTEHQQQGDAGSPSDTLDRDQSRGPNGAPDHTDPHKGNPRKGAHQFGDDGGDRGGNRGIGGER